MGLLSEQGPQDWHLAPAKLREACNEANKALVDSRNSTLQAVALGFGLNSTRELGCNTVVGCTTPQHVYELLERWRSLFAAPVEGGRDDEKRIRSLDIQRQNESLVTDILGKTGLLK